MGIHIRMLNLGHGESNIIMLQDGDKTFNILIDGGSERKSKTSDKTEVSSKKIVDEIKKYDIELNGIIVTHVDDDHIGGIINILGKYYKDIKYNLKIFFVLFNNYDEHRISFNQGNKLTALIKNKLISSLLINSYKTNYQTENKLIQERVDCDGNKLEIQFFSLESRTLMKKINDNKIYITMLTPDIKDINQLMKEWRRFNNTDDKTIKKSIEKGLGEVKNKSSIGFLLEFHNKKMVFGGDGYLKDIQDALKVINSSMKKHGNKKIELDVFKLLHHGSYENNKEICEFVKEYNCKKIIYNTNSINYQNHPDIGLIYSIIKDNPSLEIYATNKITKEIVNAQYDEYKKREEQKVENKDDIPSKDEMTYLLGQKVKVSENNVDIKEN